VDRILEEVFLTKTTEEWMRLFDETEVPAGPIYTLDKALQDPQVQFRNMVVEIDSPHTGPLKDLGNPIKMSDMGTPVYQPAPLLGEHTESLLTELLGFSAQDLSALREKKII
jgi:CoA:oxalate CoA-transferase